MSVLRPVLTLLVLALLAAPSFAESDTEIEIDRPADELSEELTNPVDPEDPDAVDSALVFTSNGGPAAVRCVARNGNGDRVGHPVIVKLPADGLRWVRASDLSNGTDFVGSARCTSLGSVAGSGFVVGPHGATNLRVSKNRTRLGRHGKRFTHHLRFPVIASY
ncbi:MAG: hypothetical protein GY723_16235 [bacterium]|nr:hypothetical protein [bacterium]